MVRFCNSVKSDQDIDPDKSKLPVVPFQGFGFIILPGESFMGCRFGDDYSFRKNLRRKAERQVQSGDVRLGLGRGEVNWPPVNQKQRCHFNFVLFFMQCFICRSEVPKNVELVFFLSRSK